MRLRCFLLSMLTLIGAEISYPCTSAMVSGRVSLYGSPMLWKHRDTSQCDNYVDSVNGTNPEFDYIALFNASDSLKKEAWAGVNRAGFAIINTVAGNLPENSKKWKDREGYVMSLALSQCRTVDDFERLLDSLPKPLGVRTNFGVMDKNGDGAYFETDDFGYVKYDVNDSESGILVRSNYSLSSKRKGGYGYDRYCNAEKILERNLTEGISPELFTEFLSREYYSAVTDSVYMTCVPKTITDKGFIPRKSSASSVVIELTGAGPIMWTMLGYPPAAVTVPVTIDSIPPNVRRNHISGKSSDCEKSNKLKSEIINEGKIVFPAAYEITRECKRVSLENYKTFRDKKSQSR